MLDIDARARRDWRVRWITDSPHSDVRRRHDRASIRRRGAYFRAPAAAYAIACDAAGAWPLKLACKVVDTGLTMPERILALSREVSDVAKRNVSDLQRITGRTKILALNSLIEAGRAGQAGRGFAVVAKEIGEFSAEVNRVTDGLQGALATRLSELDRLGKQLITNIRGTRLADLALNMIEIIDRNLYERSCDVRWWATDSAVVDCAADPSAERRAHASRRLGVILDSYTVYLDLWVVDARGTVLANGRPDRYPNAAGRQVGHESWFRQAMATQDGSAFAVADIARNDGLEGRSVATYAAAIRAGGETHGPISGVLGIFFDWEGQAQAVVDGVRLLDEERPRTRQLILDAKHRVLAASDRRGILTETFPLDTGNRTMGSYGDGKGTVVGFALTPGYETYAGLGWYGVLVQRQA